MEAGKLVTLLLRLLNHSLKEFACLNFMSCFVLHDKHISPFYLQHFKDFSNLAGSFYAMLEVANINIDN